MYLLYFEWPDWPDGQSFADRIDYPTLEELQEAVRGVDIANRAGFIFKNDDLGAVICSSAEFNRVLIQFHSDPKIGHRCTLLDAALTNSDEQIKVLDEEDIIWLPVCQTVEKPYALQVLTYFYERQYFPLDSEWEGPMDEMKGE